MIDQQDLAVKAQCCQRLRERLRLVIIKAEGIHYVQLVFFELLCERRFQRSAKHFLRQGCLVIPWARAEYRPAFPPQWIPDFSDARPARTFLTPGLFTATLNFSPGLCLVSPGSQACQVLLD